MLNHCSDVVLVLFHWHMLPIAGPSFESCIVCTKEYGRSNRWSQRSLIKETEGERDTEIQAPNSKNHFFNFHQRLLCVDQISIGNFEEIKISKMDSRERSDERENVMKQEESPSGVVASIATHNDISFARVRVGESRSPSAGSERLRRY